ncbi:MAG: FHA domain-containing protein, partial [Planctomycetota bacterium]
MSANDFKIVYDQGSFDIREGANVIGRKDADITIPVSSLSKEHARIIRAGSRLEIEDAGSKNGTLLNDEPVQGRMLVEPGDVITLGGKVELHVVDGDQPMPPPKSAKVAGLDDSKRSADAPPRRDDRPSASDAPPPATATFTIIQGDGKGRVVDVTADKQFTLGSKEENGLPLKGEGISRYHAEVVFEKGIWLLKDLGSRNGTFVRERKVDLHELVTGDVVQIGSAHLRFEAIEARKPGDPRDLLTLVKEDPKAALKSPHLRRAGMLLVGAAALGIMALAKQKPEEPPPPPIDPGETIRTVHDAIELLRKDEAGKADALIGKAIRALGPYRQNVTYNNLEKVVKRWVDHKAPLTFEWSEAVQAIDVVIRGSTPETVDQHCVEWLQKARTEAEAE